MPPKKLVQKKQIAKSSDTFSEEDLFNGKIIGSKEMIEGMVNEFTSVSSLSQYPYNMNSFITFETFNSYFMIIFKESFFSEYISVQQSLDENLKVLFEHFMSILSEVYSLAVEILFNPPKELVSSFQGTKNLFLSSLTQKLNDRTSLYYNFFNRLNEVIQLLKRKETEIVSNFSSSISVTNYVDMAMSSPSFSGYSNVLNPTNVSSFSVFENYCKTIGKQIDTGPLFLTVSEMVDIYRSGLRHHINNISPVFRTDSLSLRNFIIPASILSEFDNFDNCSNNDVISKFDKFESLMRIRVNSFKFIRFFIDNIEQNVDTVFDTSAGDKSLESSFSKIKGYFFEDIISFSNVTSLLEKELQDGEKESFQESMAFNHRIYKSIYNDNEVNIPENIKSFGEKIIEIKKRLKQNNEIKKMNKEILDFFTKNVKISNVKKMKEYEDLLLSSDGKRTLANMIKSNFFREENNSFYISTGTDEFLLDSTYKNLYSKIRQIFLLKDEIQEARGVFLINKATTIFEDSENFRQFLSLPFCRDCMFASNLSQISENEYSCEISGENIIFPGKFRRYVEELISLSDEEKEILLQMEQWTSPLSINRSFSLERGFISKLSLFFRLNESPKNGDYIPYNKIVIGSEESTFELYFWQRKMLKYGLDGKSFIVWGATSGGKTHAIMLLIIALLSRKRSLLFVYCAPTEPLVIQTYANIKCTIPSINVSLVTQNITLTNSSSSVIIGTPKELSDFLSLYNPQDFNINGSNEAKMENCISRKTMRSQAFIAFDEIHVAAMTETSKNFGNASISSILTSLKRISSDEVQVVALTASFNDQSYSNCKDFIVKFSGITDIELVKYTKENSKMIDEPMGDLPKIETQSLCAISFYNQRIQSINSTEISESPIVESVDERFILSFIHKAMNDGRDPLAIFFEDSHTAIEKFVNTVNFFHRIDSGSDWTIFKKMFRENTPNSKDVKNVIMGYISSIRRKTSSNGIKVSEETFGTLITDYNRSVPSEFAIDKNTELSIDLYALLREFRNCQTGNTCFTSVVHPYLNFGRLESLSGILKIKTSGENTVLGDLLEGQYIQLNANTNFINTILLGFKYGLALYVASLPVAIQVEISSLLMRIKKGNEIQNLVILCDDTLASGVDFFLKGIGIFYKNPTEIKQSLYKQVSGRGGRNDSKGNYIESTVYCVNVSNCSTLLSEDDILNFPKNTTESLYYKADQVYDVLKQITDTLTSRSGKVVKGVYKGDISVFRSERMFPNISQFHTTVDRDMYIKNCLQELFYISRILAPAVAENWIRPLFLAFQIEIFNSTLSIA